MDHDQDVNAVLMDELQVRWVVLDELSALASYAQVFGAERGVKQRVDDLREILHRQFGAENDAS